MLRGGEDARLKRSVSSSASTRRAQKVACVQLLPGKLTPCVHPLCPTRAREARSLGIGRHEHELAVTSLIPGRRTNLESPLPADAECRSRRLPPQGEGRGQPPSTHDFVL